MAPVAPLALTALLLAAPPGGVGDLGRAIAGTAADVAALRGPLEGLWEVRDSQGAVVLRLSLSDGTPDGEAITGAWLDAEDGSAALPLALVTQTRDSLTLQLSPNRSLTLVRSGPRVWRGRLTSPDLVQPVTLTRPRAR